MSNYIVGLDIGTSKIVTIIGEITNNNSIEIVGVGNSKSCGMSRGIVVDIAQMTEAIRLSIKDAELMAQYKIEEVYVGIAGQHIRCANATGSRNIEGDTVSQADITDVLERARTAPMKQTEQILHCIPKTYKIDGQGGISNPAGMAGNHLSVETHLVAALISACQNIIKCVDSCNLHCTELVLEQLASSKSVLTDDERNLGVCLIDIGDGTSDIIVFRSGGIEHTAVLPYAGNLVTTEIAAELLIPAVQAENIKIASGNAYTTLVDAEEMLEILRIGGKTPIMMSKHVVSQMAQKSYKKILLAVKKILANSNYLEVIKAGVVLTGGGSKIEGVAELAAETLEVPARVGNPGTPIIKGMSDIAGNPTYATAIGLLLYGYEKFNATENSSKSKSRKKTSSIVKQPFSVLQWLKNQF